MIKLMMAGLHLAAGIVCASSLSPCHDLLGHLSGRSRHYCSYWTCQNVCCKKGPLDLSPDLFEVV